MNDADAVPLPTGSMGLQTGLASLLDRRRSRRAFGRKGIALQDLARVLWSGSGRRSGAGRVVPSAHGLHQLSITVLAGNVSDLSAGAYLYGPEDHQLQVGTHGDHRDAIAATTLVDREWSATAAALLVVTADLDVLNTHFADQPPHGLRGERYAWLEAGHISQSIYLAATDLDLAVVLIAGFDDDRLSAVTTSLVPTLPRGSRAVAIIALGEPEEEAGERGR
ncbi:SagB/ThcOx family dehydrogenase [Citricoccus sp. GCM10030269]|uniref:SagB/ThcOx family dehydrogenase n=1 Tax=Citricoccus sp. GCM10030269 TaxID=3273388 RepID=UPI0036216F4B